MSCSAHLSIIHTFAADVSGGHVQTVGMSVTITVHRTVLAHVAEMALTRVGGHTIPVRTTAVLTDRHASVQSEIMQLTGDTCTKKKKGT